MKNLARKSLVAIGLMMSLSTFANDTAVTLKEKENNVTNMRFENVKKGSTLSIIDEHGLVLYNEAIEQNGLYVKGFDLTTLPNGDYSFELNSELKIVVIPFNVNSSEVVFDKESKESIYKPVLRIKDNIVFVSRTTIEQTPLSYKIYYADNYDLVDAENFDELEEVKKAYDFSNSEKGNYIFVFESKGRKYSKTIKI
jgi:outer membrane lipoprotein-sorting protein